MLDKQNQLSIIKHNENVTKNRNILIRIIDAVCYLAKQGSSFREHDETTDSIKRGHYIELLNLISKYDEHLANHLNNTTVFSDTSNRVQNDIITSINHILKSEIKKELKDTPFVAVMLDETSNISPKSQLSVVLRYINYSGLVVERFLCFKDISADCSSNSLSKFILDTILTWECENKLIAQTYDGAIVMASELNDTQKKVKDIHPQAMFVYCYAHVLNLVLSESVLHIKECKIFFAAVSGIASFLSQSFRRNNALNETIQRNFPNLVTTRWNYSSLLVNTIKDLRESLCEYFENIIEYPENWDNESINMAKSYSIFLDEFNSQFLLNIFAKIFGYTNVLFNLLQTSNLDIGFTIKKVNEIKTDIKAMKNTTIFEEVYSDSISIVGPPSLHKKRRLKTEMQDLKLNFELLYNDILDSLYDQIDVRFGNLSSLKFIELLNFKFYQKYQKKFPIDCFNSLKESYNKYFDFTKLSNELHVLYRSESFVKLDISELIQHIRNHDLIEGLSEVNKLAYLICTIPFTTASVERSFSALKRIETCTHNTMDQNRLSNLALIMIEKELLYYLHSKPDFYDDVINDFVNSSDGRINLVYK